MKDLPTQMSINNVTSKIDSIIEKSEALRQSGEEAAPEILDKSDSVCIWGFLEGRDDSKVCVRIGDSKLSIGISDILEVEELDKDAIPGEPREVFLTVKGSSEISTTVKDEAILVKVNEAAGESKPFAIGKQSNQIQVSEEDLKRQEVMFEEWRRKVKLLENYFSSKGRSICTLMNTQKWTTAGTGDVGTVSDGAIGDGCEDY